MGKGKGDLKKAKKEEKVAINDEDAGSGSDIQENDDEMLAQYMGDKVEKTASEQKAAHEKKLTEGQKRKLQRQEGRTLKHCCLLYK